MVASFAFATIGILGTFVGLHIHCMAMVFCQNAVTLLLLLPWLLKDGVKLLKSKNCAAHLLRACCGVLASFLLYLALRELDLFDVVLLENSSPMIIPFLAMIFIKEKISWTIWMCVCIGLLGIYFVISPKTRMDLDWRILLPLAAAFFAALSFIFIKVLDKEDTWQTILFYYFLFSTIISLPFLFLYPIHCNVIHDWFYLMGIGLATAIAQGFLILAYHFSDPGKLSPFSYFEVLFGLLLGRILLGTPFTQNTIIGMILILLSGMIVLVFEKRQTIKN
jgi:drug/metabolite transporter (DMT)-like permease